MAFEELKRIQAEQQAAKQSQEKHNEILDSSTSVSNTVLDATMKLIEYMEGHVSQVQVINPLKEIGTPDAYKVVSAVNDLHSTLRKHENTDLSEVTQVMREVLDQAKLIPKDLPEEKEDKDYTQQFESLTEAIKAVETVVKEQELIAEAPVINVPETQVNVEAPDLKPLQKGFRDVVNAVNKIVIPEYKTDNKAVEKLLEKSNKLLKDLLEKPIASGGGGGGRATPYQDSNGTPAFVTLENGKIPVTITGGKASDEYGINAISEDATYKYFWFEADDLDYYIMRKNKTTKVFTFTKGTGGYTTVYVNETSGPSGSPTWGTRGTTF